MPRGQDLQDKCSDQMNVNFLLQLEARRASCHVCCSCSDSMGRSQWTQDSFWSHLQQPCEAQLTVDAKACDPLKILIIQLADLVDLFISQSQGKGGFLQVITGPSDAVDKHSFTADSVRGTGCLVPRMHVMCCAKLLTSLYMSGACTACP